MDFLTKIEREIEIDRYNRVILQFDERLHRVCTIMIKAYKENDFDIIKKFIEKDYILRNWDKKNDKTTT